MGTTEPPAPGSSGLVARLIALCSRQALLTVVLALMLGAWGVAALRHQPLDAIPDLSDVQVIIATDWPGRSPDLIEDQLTYPITAALLGAPHIKAVRGQSQFGTSLVYAIFDDGTDIYWARSRVLEYLNAVQGTLPAGVVPHLGPDASGVGWVYEYALVDRSGKHDLQQLRSLQDWHLRYGLASVPGVAEVASVGGFVKQYQVQCDPLKLLAYHVSVPEIANAIRASNAEVSGDSIEIAGHEQMIRGRGYITSLADIEGIALRTASGGTPLRIGDVATVAFGPEPRRGIADLDGQGEVVGGIVIMRYGQNALTVIEQVKQRLSELQAGLPAGVAIVPTYDRSELIRQAVHTLLTTILEEMAVVAVVVILFLQDLRAALVPILVLPLAVLIAFIPAAGMGLTANIMSLGGIAVAIGAMVDAAMIMVENVHRRLERWQAGGCQGPRQQVVIDSLQEVGPPVCFALLVITASFLPILALEGREGRLFAPLAFTKTFAMGAAAILAVTLAPALVALLMRGPVAKPGRDRLNRLLVAAYEPVVRLVVRRPLGVVALALAAMAATVPAFLHLGSEFMPPLNEGVILYMPTSAGGMSATEAGTILQALDRRLSAFPEVASVFGKMGRSTSATDPAPLNMAETIIQLRPRDQWPAGMTWEKLIAQLRASMHYPGMSDIWWMPIQTRTEMLDSGVRSPLAVRIFGDDLAEIERTGLSVERAVEKVPGVASAFTERTSDGYYLDLTIRRPEAARLGLHVQDIDEAVMGAIGGVDVSQTVEGRERYAINVRYAREFRDDPEQLRRTLIPLPNGGQVPLAEVADLQFVTGPPMISSQDGKLVGYVFIDVAGRPYADVVADAQAQVARTLQLAPGIRLSWVGEYQAYERAKARMALVAPLTLAVVAGLLLINTGSLVETLMVLCAVPFSLIGAIWLMALLHYNLSVAVWVGMIALAGLDAETGVVMLLYLRLSWDQHRAAGGIRDPGQLADAIVDGAARRLRPKLMTVLAALVGLLPVLWSSGTGADLMKRIAAPMVGGLGSSFLLELLVYPALFALWKRRGLSQSPAPGSTI